LLVECKTLHGYNIILAPEDDNCDVLPEHLDYFWPGSQYDQDEDKERDSVLRQLLADAKTTAVDTRRFFQDFTRYAYPRNYMRLGDFRIDPMRAHYSGCAFRETNSEKTKDLDASVVWKSGRALKSAITSVKKSHLKWTLSFYHSTAEHTQQRKNSIVEALIKEYKNILNTIDIFLPVLVVDCRLWAYDVTTKLREVEWLRIHQRDHVGISTFWFDVVSMAKAQDYLESLTKNIETSLRAVHARPQRERQIESPGLRSVLHY
jgi:hypothetical protein